jgi:hypothetical protein
MRVRAGISSTWNHLPTAPRARRWRRQANIRFLAVTNLKDYASKHYVDIGLIADWKSGEPKVMEPEKCEGWDWYPLDRLPEPLFATVHNYITALETKNQYFDAV